MSMANGHPWNKYWQNHRNENAYFTIAVNEHNMLQHIEDDLIYGSLSASLHIFSTIPLSCDYSATFSSNNQQLPPLPGAPPANIWDNTWAFLLWGLTSKLTWRMDHMDQENSLFPYIYIIVGGFNFEKHFWNWIISQFQGEHKTYSSKLKPIG